jgi:signal transduction histidine kinase
LVEINRKALDMFGNGEVEIKGKRVSELIPGIGDRSTLAKLRGVIKTSQPFSIDDFVPEGGGRHLAVSTFKVGNGLGIIITDITELKEAEAEKLQAMADVARCIAHDIRNPLSAIRTAAFVIKEAGGPGTAKFCDLIDRDTVAADRIVRNLRDFSVDIVLKPKDVDVNDLLAQVLSDGFLPQGVKLRTRYRKLPPAQLDPDYLTRAFQNLIANATQAMPDGGELIVSTQCKANTISVTIKDTGTGVSQEDQGRIFSPFFTTKAKGTGLGLPITKRVVEAHGGSIQLTSQVGRGTMVVVRLPTSLPERDDQLPNVAQIPGSQDPLTPQAFESTLGAPGIRTLHFGRHGS